MATKTESLHVVPKKDVDRMFKALYAALDIRASCMLAQTLRGIAYSNTFLTERTITTTEE